MLLVTRQPPSDPNPIVFHYFVDEAGDLTLFNKKGKSLVGQPGVSRFFMVGVVQLFNPQQAQTTLDTLRLQLLSDPYFKDVPSMQPAAKKTALAFHAKDDLPEVRREVFKVLPDLDVKAMIAIRRKEVLIEDGRALFRYGKKLRANDIYDDLVKRLFRNLLHKADENQMLFARRGKSARKDALSRAIERAKRNFAWKRGQLFDVPTQIKSAYPTEHIGLQIADYYLWALQRLYEANEDRYFCLLANNYRLIMDLDDTRQKPYGTWYSDANPLVVKKINPRSG